MGVFGDLFSKRDASAPLPMPHGRTTAHLRPTITRKTMYWFIGIALLAVILAATALGIAVHNMSSRSFDSLTVKHLRVNVDEKRPEGILIAFAGKDSQFAGGAAGVRVDMPLAHSQGSSQQAGVLVEGGQYGLYTDAPQTAGVFVKSPPYYAYAASQAAAGSILVNNDQGEV